MALDISVIMLGKQGQGPARQGECVLKLLGVSPSQPVGGGSGGM